MQLLIMHNEKNHRQPVQTGKASTQNRRVKKVSRPTIKMGNSEDDFILLVWVLQELNLYSRWLLLKRRNRGNALKRLWREQLPKERWTRSLPISNTRRRSSKVATTLSSDLASTVADWAMVRVLPYQLGRKSLQLGIRSAISVMLRVISSQGVLTWPVLILPVLTWPVLTWLVLTWLVPTWLVLTLPVLNSTVMSGPVLSWPVLSWPVLSLPVLSWPVQTWPVVTWLFLTWPVLTWPVLT